MREVHLGDALELLPRLGPFHALVTNPPDAAEVGLELGAYDDWLGAVGRACMAVVEPLGGLAVFAVTDRRYQGRTYSKAGRLLAVCGPLVWHRIALRRPPGSRDLFRPTYTHLLAFGNRSGGPAGADVIDGGLRLWRNGLGVAATRACVHWARPAGPTIIDPFCGYGTTLVLAEALYDRVVGIDIDPAMVERARELQ